MRTEVHDQDDPRARSLSKRSGREEHYLALLQIEQQRPEIAAAVAEAARLYRDRHLAYVNFLRGNGKARPALGHPGHEHRSPKWREADAAYFGALRTLAAVFGALHPTPNGNLPLDETLDLIKKHVGLLCTGWSTRESKVIDQHHPDVHCPIHVSDTQG